jgi:hypothetical protein
MIGEVIGQRSVENSLACERLRERESGRFGCLSGEDFLAGGEVFRQP